MLPSDVKLEISHVYNLETHAKIQCKKKIRICLFVVVRLLINRIHEFYKNKFFCSSKLSMNSIWCDVGTPFERNLSFNKL